MLDRIHPSESLSTANPGKYDLLFIGGGLSGTLTLIQVLKELRSAGAAVKDLRSGHGWRIAVANTSGDFGGGLPYGRSVHPMLLLNNDIATMNICGFQHWLAYNRDLWLGMLRAQPTAGIKGWLRFNQAALCSAEYEAERYLSLFLPRCVFGLFIADFLAEALTEARDLPARVDLLQDEVVSLARSGKGFRIGFRNGAALDAGTVVLALGSLPPDPAPDLDGTPGYIHNMNPPSGAQLQSVLQTLSKEGGKSGRIAIIGSHASAMEAIYTIALEHSLDRIISKVVVISPSGRLPDAHSSGIAAPFEPQTLHGLIGARGISARQVITAALQDAAQARQLGYSSIDYSPPLCSVFRRVFESLSANEKRRFVEQFGMQFTALNRQTPPEYAAAARGLMREGRLRLIAAEVTAISPPHGAASGFTVAFKKANGVSGQLCAAAVVNCRGSGTLAGAENPLLREILRPDSRIARSNCCGRGIAVSEDLEASPRLFVAGPLLAGHSCGSDHLWNLESAQRLDWLARRLAPIIVARLTSSSPSVPRTEGVCGF